MINWDEIIVINLKFGFLNSDLCNSIASSEIIYRMGVWTKIFIEDFLVFLSSYAYLKKVIQTIHLFRKKKWKVTCGRHQKEAKN